jgi:voltage-dependent potassium channel beta subunit
MSAPEMRYNNLGKCGLKVSAFGLGGWTTFGDSVKAEDTVKTIMRRAFEAGVNFFDIADIYAKGESEKAMGKVLKEFPRHELVVTSKAFWPMSDDVNDRGLSRKHLMESVEKSLKRIGTDYLDIYFCHRFDSETPVEETCRAMDDLVHQGKILYWGTSEWSGAQISEALEICDRRNLYMPAVEQPQYSLLARDRFENDVAPVTLKAQVGTVVWSPLASGFLTGKYDNGIPPGTRLDRIDFLKEQLYQDDNISKIKKFGELSDKIGVSRSQLALAWALASPAVSSVILGATRIEQLEENLGALDVKMDQELRAELDEIFKLA